MREAPKQRGLNSESHPLHSFIQPQPNWTEIVNKKLKFPPLLLSAIQEARLGLVQQLLESGVETTGVVQAVGQADPCGM